MNHSTDDDGLMAIFVLSVGEPGPLATRMLAECAQLTEGALVHAVEGCFALVRLTTEGQSTRQILKGTGLLRRNPMPFRR